MIAKDSAVSRHPATGISMQIFDAFPQTPIYIGCHPKEWGAARGSIC